MRKMRILMIVALAIFGVLRANGQADDKQAVEAVVVKLFKAMELGDSAMARETFAVPLTSATIGRDKSGTTVLHRESSSDGFLAAIGTPRKDVLYEEIWDIKVEIDGDLAQLWCQYAFYVGNKFSHCGVDAFQLVRQAGEWKIFHIADTRRREGCTIPEDIRKKHQ